MSSVCIPVLLLAITFPDVASSQAISQPLVFAQISMAQAERMAVTGAPEVLAAQAHLEESRYALLAARGGIAPSLMANYVQSPQGNPPGPSISSQLATIGLQTTIGDFFTYSPLVREAALTMQAAQADESAAEMAERVKVIGLYYDALKERALAQARAGALELATAQRNATRVRIRAGDAPALDAVRADVAVAKATADLETAKALDLNASDALCGESGCAVHTLAATAPGSGAPLKPLVTDPQVAVALARRLRPEIASAQRAIEAARAASAAARAAGFPTFTLSAGYAHGNDSGVPVSGPGISAQLTFALSSAARSRAALASTRVLQAQAKAIGIERAITLAVAAAARTLGGAQRAAAATTLARQLGEEELRAVDLGYRNGVSSGLELTSARAAYTQARIDELTAFYDLVRAREILTVEVGR